MQTVRNPQVNRVCWQVKEHQKRKKVYQVKCGLDRLPNEWVARSKFGAASIFLFLF